MSKNKYFLPAFILIAILCGGAYTIWQSQQKSLPAYITSGNGRIEAEEANIATQYAGRVIEILVNEGDMVKQNDIIARIDTKDLSAQKNGILAKLEAAKSAVTEAEAQITHQDAKLDLAQTELRRAEALVEIGISRELYDQRKAAVRTAKAALNIAKAQRESVKNQMNTIQADIDRINILIDDSSLKAPMNGRIQYRLAEPGEVLGAGSRVATILDLENVYMTIFLPTKDIGKITIGSQARIILDAIPNIVIPAKVSFISPEAQFTPRTVETREEREKLMFRVKIQIPKTLLSKHIEKVRTGLPGVGYVLLDEKQHWPSYLEVNIPDTDTDTNTDTPPKE